MSLNKLRVLIKKIIPIPIKIIPGKPKNFRGFLRQISSIKETTTSEVWDIGFFVEVLPPVL